MARERRHDRFAWARLNAYGVLVAGLSVLSLTDLLHPGGTELARLIGDVPPGQPAWATGFIIAGLLMLVGFVRGDRIAETIALVLMFVGVVAQTIVAFAYLGLTEFTYIRLALIALVGLVALARSSALWPKYAMFIRIPARGEHEGEQ